MFAYVRTIQLQRDKIDEAVRIWREEALPLLKAASGFREFVWMCDPATGQTQTIALWDSEPEFNAAMDNPALDEPFGKFPPLRAGEGASTTFEVRLHETHSSVRP